jgi:hypothetical protein
MKKISLPLVLFLCTFPSLGLSATAEDHLANAIKCLRVVSGEEIHDAYDITHNGNIGLDDIIHELILVSGVQIQPVSIPTLRMNLPGSWDEDWFASPAVYDLDGDGNREIIAGRHSVIYVWDSAGALKWSAPVGLNATPSITHGSSRQYASPVVGDLDGDGKGEVAVAYSNKVVIYDHNGLVQSGWPQSFPNSTSEIRSIAAADLNGNGKKEILAVKTSSGPVTVVWNSNGSVLAGWPQVNNCPECNNFGGYNQNIGAADLDGDLVPEVISTFDICHIGLNYANGSPMPANSVFSGLYASSVPMFHDIDLAIQGWGPNGNDRDEFTDSPPVFADLDGDTIAEVILYSDHERAGEYINRGNCLWALNADMTRVPGFEVPICSAGPLYTGYENNIVQIAPAPALANVTGDSRMEIIVPSYDGYMRAFSPEGALLWSYQFDVPGGVFIGASGSAAGDLNGDGIPEIIFSTYSIVENVSHLIILDSEGTQLHKIALAKRGSMSVPTLADVDGDGILEIIVSLKDRLDYTFGGVQVYEVSSAMAGYIPWPTGRGNLNRDGQSEM